MKKLVIVSILASVAWGQVCSVDGLQMKQVGTDARPDGNGNNAYLFECDPTYPNPKHQRWIVVQKQNSYQPQQQQYQQQTQQQQVLPNYDPLIDAAKDKRTEEQKRKDEEELQQWVAEMKKTRKGRITLYITQAVIIYFIYYMVTDSN